MAQQNRTFGWLSEKYESSNRGVGMISSGRGDPGGVSYGRHQLSSQYSMGAFLRSKEGAPYRSAFGNHRPGSRAFSRIYSAVAQRDPQGFAAAQQAYLVRSHFRPVEAIARDRGFNVEDRAVQEALYSMSVQHGRARQIVSRAAARLPEGGGGVGEQLRALYGERYKYVAGLNTLPASTQASVLNRFEREFRDAVQLAGMPGVQLDRQSPVAVSGANAPVISPEGLQNERISPVAEEANPLPHPAEVSGAVGKGGSHGPWPAWANAAFNEDSSAVDPVQASARISPVPPPPPRDETFGWWQPGQKRQPIFRPLLGALFGGGGGFRQ